MMKTRQSSLRRRMIRPDRGFAMLEALVGLLIFSIGILGIVGVQASMTAAQTQSKFRADAASLASELVGTMWSDVTNLPSYNGASCASYTRCGDWSAKVGRVLPSGTPSVAVAGATVTITITWMAPNETTPSRYVTVSAING